MLKILYKFCREFQQSIQCSFFLFSLYFLVLDSTIIISTDGRISIDLSKTRIKWQTTFALEICREHGKFFFNLKKSAFSRDRLVPDNLVDIAAEGTDKPNFYLSRTKGEVGAP